MNVDKSHKKSPRRVRASATSKPIERVSTRKLVESIKRDIQAEIKKAKESAKSKD